MPDPPNGQKRMSGLGYATTALFLITQMAGAGFLSLPKATANTGWLGVAMMVVFSVGVGFAGTRLGKSWVILEERWPAKYAGGSRQPYMDIAGEALGNPGRVFALVCVFLTLFGSATVYLILMASFISQLAPVLSVCEWLCVVTLIMLPFTWLGTPKDFWQASVVAAASTGLACMVIFVELIVESPDYPEPQYTNPTAFTFALGFASILFAFGGASVFPTIQNDMADRALFSRSVVIAFLGLLLMYLPVAVTGYAVLGVKVEGNILLNVDTERAVIKAAIVMEVLNLAGTYIITCNPVYQVFEEHLHIEKGFGWKRCVMRSCIVAAQLVLGLAIPMFDKILNLIGGSTVTGCTFLLPGLCYLRLADRKGDWQRRVVPLWERTALILTICVGLVGGVASTISAVLDIIDPDSMGQSCFVDFEPPVE